MAHASGQLGTIGFTLSKKKMNNSNFPAWQNDKFCYASDVSIRMQDFGLLRSYGVYEVISIKNNCILALDQHINRFLQGCKYYYINIPYKFDNLVSIIKELNAQVTEDIHVWLIVTRGEPVSYDTHDVLNAVPNVAMITAPYSQVNDGNALRLSISRKVRRISDMSINQKYKNFARQDFTIAQIETSLKGFNGPLLLDNNDLLTEGPQFSVAIIKDGKVMSPAKNRLPGITMDVIRLLCQEHNIEFAYCDITEELLNSADDMFATSTAGGVISIIAVDNKQFVETALQQKLKNLYQQAWNQDKYSIRI
jgi:branched-chain amino acid aminotransferase